MNSVGKHGIRRGDTMAAIEIKGDYEKTEKFFQKALGLSYRDVLEHYGKVGVEALRNATPVDTGTTAASWYYEIEENQNGCTITWCNSNVVGGWANVAVLIQRGHGTRQGGYVQGIDYINPALAPIFLDIAEKAFKEVAKL